MGEQSLSVGRLHAELVRPGGLWREVTVVAETGSTNADLLARAGSGAQEGLVLAAEAQTAGRGRLGRSWISPPGAALAFSVVLRPRGVPAGLLGWVPLLAGVATATAVRAVTGVGAQLKWPNDVLARDAKLAGILAESRGEAIVVGIGINVSQRRSDLPVPGATSLVLEAGPYPDASGSVRPVPAGPRATTAGTAMAGARGRERLLVAVLRELARRYTAWRDQDEPGDARACGLHAEYLRLSATLGREVTVMLPGGATMAGTAVGIDTAGRLEVASGAGVVPVSAGDIVHLR